MLNRIKLIVYIITLFTVIGCNNSKEPPVHLKRKLKTGSIVKSKKHNLKKDSRPNFDSIKYPKEIKPFRTVLPPTLIIYESAVHSISCFNPNLKIEDAIKLVNEGAEDTQWFVVERKEGNFQKNKLNVTDTIFMQNELKKIGWKLIDSTLNTLENRITISLKSNIEKKNSV